MTDQEKQDFVNAVKEKKIRYWGWGKDAYFIPNGKQDRSGTFFRGMHFHSLISVGYLDGWRINNGFDDYDGHSGWEYCEKSQLVTEFKVGDLVVCKPNPPNTYDITNETAGEIEVVEISINDGHMWLKVEGHAANFYVETKHFKLAPKGNSAHKTVSLTPKCTCSDEVWRQQGCKCGAIKPYEFKY